MNSLRRCLTLDLDPIEKPLFNAFYHARTPFPGAKSHHPMRVFFAVKMVQQTRFELANPLI
jgi:hypothetical protein